MAQESFATVAKRRLLGLAYIVVLFGLISLSVAVYNKAFTPVTMVTLKTDHTGNQLLDESDVKLRGIIVGSVRSVKSTGDGASIKLALNPGRTKLIPKNVSAQILPKTLFGEQYVALQMPADDTAPHIKSGDVIEQDRSTVALEAQKVLGDFLPLLQAVQPAELNATLTAMAEALKGRGEKLGQTLVSFDNYLKVFNPNVPQLVKDLEDLGSLSDELDKAAPDLFATLNNFQTGARTVLDKQAALDSLLTTADSTSNILNSFLSDNQQRLITVVDTSEKVYGLLKEYSPEYGCMLHGLAALYDRTSRGISNKQIQLSAQLYVVTPKLGAYKPGDEPRFLTGLGPNCFGLPNPQVPFKVPGNFRCLNDGASLTGDPCSYAAQTTGFDQQSVGSPQENLTVKSVLAHQWKTDPAKVSDLAALMVAPTLRGEAVVLK